MIFPWQLLYFNAIKYDFEKQLETDSRIICGKLAQNRSSILRSYLDTEPYIFLNDIYFNSACI